MSGEVVHAKGTEASYWKEYELALVLFIGATIVCRFLLTLVVPRIIRWDEADYLLLARNLFAGQGFTSGIQPELHFTPLYPVLAGAFYCVFGDFELASNFAYALFGGLMLAPVFLLARRTYDEKTAWLSIALLAVFPSLTVQVLFWGTFTEPLYLCLLYSGAAAVLIGLEEQRCKWLATGGLFLGLAYLTRPEGISYFFMLLLFALAWFLLKQTDAIRDENTGGLANEISSRLFRAWKPLACFTLSYIMLAGPYLVFLHAHTGYWMLTGKLGITWDLGDAVRSHNYAAYDYAWNRLDGSGNEIMFYSPERFQFSLWRKIKTDPEAFLRRISGNARELPRTIFGNKHIFWYPLLTLLFLGFFRRAWNRNRLSHEALLLSLALPLLGFLAFHIELRFFASLFPILLIWTANGALELGAWLSESAELISQRETSSHRIQGLLTWFPAGSVLLFFIMMYPGSLRAGVASTTFAPKTAGLWLREHTPPRARIMARVSSTALYADRAWIPFPNANWNQVMAYIQQHRADYLVVEDYDLRCRPSLSFLIANEKALPSDLELSYSFLEGGHRSLIYRLSPSSFHE